MTSYLPFAVSSSPFTRTKRKMSGPASSIAASLDKSLSLPVTMHTTINASPTHSTVVDACRAIDVREVVGFLVFVVVTIILVALSVVDWIVLCKFIIAPTAKAQLRLLYTCVWVILTTVLYSLRRTVRSRVDQALRTLGDHIEIFIGVSLVMMFAVNVAFYIHVPSTTPLPDLGFWLIPEQALDSPWRPLSDLLTAIVPVAFMLQSFLMHRSNRVVVLCTFFRCATVSYLLRTVTIALTSLPGPAPHCRKDSLAASLPPQNWLDIVTRVGPMYGNYNSCGDLIFSGHMAYTTTAVLLYLRVLDRHVARGARVRWFVGASYLVVLAALCIAGRKHYTVDVVLGVIVAALVFFHFEHSWTPLCVTHPLGSVAVDSRSGDSASSHQTGSNSGASATLCQVDLYRHKRFSVDAASIDEFDEYNDDDETRGLLSNNNSSSSSNSGSSRSGGSKQRLDTVALIC